MLMPILFETITDSTTLCLEATSPVKRLYQSQVNRAMEYLQDAQVHASNPAGLLLLVRSYCWLGEPEKAVEPFRRYSILQPSNVSGRLEWWRSLGKALEERKNWDKAIQVYQLALAEFSRAADLHVNLGVAFFRRGDSLDTAAREIQKGIEIDPQVDFHLIMGQLLTEAGQFQEADGWYLRGIQIEPHSPWGYQLRADNTWASGDLLLARQMYQQIIRDFPDFSQAYFQAALVYRLDDRRESAIEAIEHALALMDPPEPWYYVRAAEIYDWAGDSAKALVAYQQALKLDATNSTARQGIQHLGGK